MDHQKASISESELNKTFDIDGVPVIDVKIMSPIVSGISPKAAGRINRFYSHESEKHISHIKKYILPAISDEFKKALRSGSSFETLAVTSKYAVSENSEKYISIYRDVTEKTRYGKCRTTRLADTWDTATGWQIRSENILDTKTRRKIIKNIISKAEDYNISNNTQFFSEYKKLIKSRFNSENFYLSDSNIVFFYNSGVIAPNFEGIISFLFCNDNN